MFFEWQWSVLISNLKCTFTFCNDLTTVTFIGIEAVLWENSLSDVGYATSTGCSLD